MTFNASDDVLRCFVAIVRRYSEPCHAFIDVLLDTFSFDVKATEIEWCIRIVIERLSLEPFECVGIFCAGVTYYSKVDHSR